MKTATLMHGSPNVVNYVPVLARNAFVWGDVQRDWLLEKSPGTNVIIIGRPEISQQEVKRSSTNRVIICHSRESLSASEAQAMEVEIRIFRDRGHEVILRLHPTAARLDLDKPWTSIAGLADRVMEGRESLMEILRPADVVVCVSSSAAVEAIAMGIPAIVFADSSRVLPSDLEAIRRSTPSILLELAGAGAYATDASPLNLLSRRLVHSAGKEAGMRLDDSLVELREQ